jgi:ATP-dependent exoDNAse (exonuclease V) beta subunit
MIVSGHRNELEPALEGKESSLEHRILMYVAATRARKSLLVCRIHAT